MLQLSDTVKLKWYCGCYDGNPRWHDCDRFEPDECDAEGELEADRHDWEEGDVTMMCTECSALLSQRDDHFTLVEQKEKANDRG